jgi:hypothetical protein
MSRAHAEISHLVRRFGLVLDDLEDAVADGGEVGGARAVGSGADAVADQEDVLELRRLLYGLHAILVLHTAQEDEGYLSLAEEPEAGDVDPDAASTDPRPSSPSTHPAVQAAPEESPRIVTGGLDTPAS